MSTVRSDNYANRVGDKSVPAETVVNGTAKAWINFDGTGTTNRQSFNVSSRTNTGTGMHVINFSSAFATATYSTVATARAGGALFAGVENNYTTTAVSMGSLLSNTAAYTASAQFHTAHFGSLA